MRSSEDYISNRAWLRAVVGGKAMVLRNVSALEFLQLFVGYFSEKKVDVYSLEKEEYDDVQCHIIPSFDEIDYLKFGNTLCSTANQAINDMLSDFDNIDETILVEALSKYYFSHNESFDGLSIKPENMEKFELLKDWAINYYG